MRNYSKTGGKPGRPGYRTPSSFRSKKSRAALKMLGKISRTWEDSLKRFSKK